MHLVYLPHYLAEFFYSYDHTVLAQSSSKGNANTSNSTSITTPQTTNSLNNAVDKLNFTTAVGIMSSLQNDASGKPAWIVSGEWQMLLFKSHIELKKVQSALATFSTDPDDGTSKWHSITPAFNVRL